MLHPQFDRPKLLALMRAEFDFTLRTLEIARADEWEVSGAHGEWSVKDTVAHLAAWNGRFVMWTETFAASGRPTFSETGHTYEEVDELNRITRERDRSLSAQQARERFVDSCARVLPVVEAMPEEHLLSSTAFGFPGISMRDLIAQNTYLHCFHHVSKLRVWLAQRRDG